ncbi:MAG: ABC transporter ATP-binding protein [Ruminococcus sp.]|nr:ABC transporter ATP-binding protein [Ruminococcus sp.]
MNAIEITGLRKEYKDFTLGDITLSLPSGCILGLIGENGAGKTTLIKSLLGITIPTSGSAVILGKAVGDNTIHDDIGVVLDEVGMPMNFNTSDIDLVMKNTYTKWSSEVFFDYVRRFKLPEKKKFSEFSKGMKMKLGIAAALSHEPKLLILDEPTSGLDPLVRDEIVDILSEYTRDEEHSILISSHIVSDLEKLCDYIAFLHDGKLMLFEEKDRLLEQYCFLTLSDDQLEAMRAEAIIRKRVNKYSTEVLADRSMIPNGYNAAPITIEELFVFMAKEVKE